MLTCIGCPQNITCFYLVFIRDFCDSCDVILLVFSLLLRLSNDKRIKIEQYQIQILFPQLLFYQPLKCQTAYSFSFIVFILQEIDSPIEAYRLMSGSRVAGGFKKKGRKTKK